MGAPQSSITVCSGVRLTPEYTHTIWFDTAEAQRAYFASKADGLPFVDYTYLRKSWSIKVGATMERARTWSYLYFTNGGKVWYYFITNIEYINDNTVELFLELDVMQTYMFDYDLLDCFVEREHSASDEIGENVVDEGLDLGEYITLSDSGIDLNDYRIMILATAHPGIAANIDAELVTSLGAKFDNVFCGLGVYAVKLGDADSFKTTLNQLSEAGRTDTIVSMWMYPGELIDLGEGINKVYTVDSTKNFDTDTFTRNTALQNGYTPRNNKLLTYPYNFLYVTNNYGSAGVYHYEMFGNPGEAKFHVVGSVSPDATITMYPLNYAGMAHNFESGLTLGSFPTCAWESDVYKMWVAQNQHSNNVAMGEAVIKAVGGVVTTGVGFATGQPQLAGAGVGVAYSGAAQIAEQIAQKRDRAIQPPEARGIYSAPINMAAGFQTFTVAKRCITEAVAKQIDNYFSMYGYKTMRVKRPNRQCRKYWTYTKTVGCQIAGWEGKDICTEDKLKIESIYNNGVTFWKNGNQIGNYSLINECTGVVG